MRQLYLDLYKLAENQMRRERRRHTLSPTGLINAAVLSLRSKLFDVTSSSHFRNRVNMAMKNLLRDAVRAKNTAKRGHGKADQSLELIQEDLSTRATQLDVLIDFSDLLVALNSHEPAWAQVFILKQLKGYSRREIADRLCIDVSTVGKHFKKARLWLASQFSS